MRKQFYLENIEGSNDFKKIETDLANKFKEIKCKINNETKVLTLTYDHELMPEELDSIFTVIKAINAKIEITEKVQLPTFRRVLILDGLDCANCAAKIERIAKRTLDHEFIVVDFATSRFIIESSNEELMNDIIQKVQAIASSVDASIRVTTKTEKNQRDNDLLNRISTKEKVFFAVGVGLFIFGLIAKYILNRYFDYEVPGYVVILVYLVAYVFLGKDIIFSAFRNIGSGRFFDEKFLMTLATLVALGIGYYDEAVSVMIFYKVGDFFQEYAVNRSRQSISSLLDIKPTSANLLVNGEIMEVDPLEVVVGDTVLVKAGERIPLDGIIIDGEASLDVSALTGEAKYLDVGVNDKVISGSVNTNGTLKVKVEKIYTDSTVSQILNMVENASALKSKSEHLITKLARYYTPIICFLAVLWALSPFILENPPQWHDFQTSIYRAMIFLVASCPCALVISIPLGFFGGIGGASRHGILVKGSNYLEALANVGSVVFDKTGTLTKGVFKVHNIVPLKGTKEELLEMAAYCEVTSNHPIANSIVKEYGKENIVSSRFKIHSDATRNGARIYLDDVDIAVGNETYMEKIKIKIHKVETDGVVVHVAKNMEYYGYIVIKDEVREEAKATIATLKSMGIGVAMVTGDKELEAKKVAGQVGIDAIFFDMLPIDKVKKLRQLRKGMPDNKKQLFVGDGINDAPVLSSADVGIAMGGLGSYAAVKVADVVLMNDDLSKLPTAINIARKTKRIVIQNILLALVVKLIVLISAPLGKSHMWEAIFADVGVSLLAILNSLRATRYKNK